MTVGRYKKVTVCGKEAYENKPVDNNHSTPDHTKH